MKQVRLAPYSPGFGSRCSLLTGRTLYVDATLFLVKFSYNSARSLSDAVGLFQQLNDSLYRLSGKKPVFVVDGQDRVDEKLRYTSHIRGNTKKFLMNKGSYAKIFVGTWRDYMRNLFILKGLDLIVATDGIEAEQLCARLATRDMENGGKGGVVVTEDSDALVFGAPAILRGVWQKKSSKPNLIESQEFLLKLGLTRDQLIDVSLMCGSDFASKIPGVGIVRAVEAIKTYGNIENYLKARATEKNWDLYQFFADNFDFQAGRRIFNRNFDVSEIHSTALDRKIFLWNLVKLSKISKVRNLAKSRAFLIKKREEMLLQDTGCNTYKEKLLELVLQWSNKRQENMNQFQYVINRNRKKKRRAFALVTTEA